MDDSLRYSDCEILVILLAQSHLQAVPENEGEEMSESQVIVKLLHEISDQLFTIAILLFGLVIMKTLEILRNKK